MITEVPIKNFHSKLKYDTVKYPQCTCGKGCPKFYFNMCCIAARQSGKTYTISKLLQHYGDNVIKDNDGNVCKLRVFIISTTIDANPVFKSLKSVDFDNDIYEECNDEALDDIIEKIDAVKQECLDYKNYKAAFSKYMKLKADEVHKLTDEELQLLTKHNFEHWKTIPEPKWGTTPPVNVVVLDDCLGTKILSSSKKSKFVNLYIRNRHRQLCFIIAVQSVRSLSREIRMNTSVFFLGKFATKKVVLEDMYEEVSNCVTQEQFEELYDHATSEKYGALIVDLTQDDKCFLKGLDAVLKLD